jgi:hypothetical protein
MAASSYLDPANDDAFVDPEVERYWMVPAGAAPGEGGIDLYVGGWSTRSCTCCSAVLAQGALRPRARLASRLVDSGFAADRRIGNVRLVRAELDSIVARPLTDLLAVTYGPMPVLTDLLGTVGGIQHAFIYGSWAARYLGEPGPVPNDLDVLVVGTADRDELDAVAQDAQHRLLRPVSVRRVLPKAWESPEPADAFLATVRERPLLALQVGIGAGTQQ